LIFGGAESSCMEGKNRSGALSFMITECPA